MTLLGQLGVPGIMPAMAEGAIWRAVVSSGIFPVKIIKLLSDSKSYYPSVPVVCISLIKLIIKDFEREKSHNSIIIFIQHYKHNLPTFFYQRIS